jgi:hypothetical protein
MPGGYLRTNFRRSVSIPDKLAIGGGYPFSSQTTMGKTGGSGTTDPYGGFIWLSWTGTTTDTTTATSLAGISARFLESTKGLMDSYFGTGEFPTGYAFQPVFAYILSLSDRVISAGEYAAAVDASLGFWPVAISLRYSGSYVLFSPLMLAGAAGTPSTVTFAQYSMAALACQIGGFIISCPE